MSKVKRPFLLESDDSYANTGNMSQCSHCTSNLDEVGGASFHGCQHILCLDCFEELVNISNHYAISCPTEKCNEVLEHGELKYLVPDDVYRRYISRCAGTGDQEPVSLVNEPFPYIDVSDPVDEENVAGATGLTSTEEDVTGWGQLSQILRELQNGGMTYEAASRHLDTTSLYVTRQTSHCPICLCAADPGEGIILKACLHIFCRDCLIKYIELVTTPEVPCPLVKECDSYLKPREVRQLSSSEVYRHHYEELSVRAVHDLPNMFHCMTPNCPYFCEGVGGSSEGVGFSCQICLQFSCFKCKVIHTGMTCSKFKKKVEEEAFDNKNRSQQRRNDALSEAEIQRRLSNRYMRRCPGCGVVIEKNGGCDHMKCNKCGLDFSWQSGR